MRASVAARNRKDDRRARTGKWEPRKARPPSPPDLAFIEKLAPPFRAVRKYCRVEVEGLENLPRGGAIVAANHTGWAGLDHANLFLTIYDRDGRILRTAVHPTFFRLPAVRAFAKRLGFFEVSVTASTKILDDGGLVLFFPEAEEGNFKSLSQFYELETFKPGFARTALAAEKPIAPVVIIGGEEANPSLGRIDVTKDLFGLALPVPLNVVPFPVKWRIKFMPSVDPVEYLKRGGAVDEDVAGQIARDVQDAMQKEIRVQLEKRGNAFF